MTCDDAFDQLTSPGGADRPQLAAHLAGCTRCRAMAETLAPAIQLFAPPPSAPVASATATALKAAARLAERSSSRRPPRSRFRQTAALLSAAIAGAACCFLAIQLSDSDPSPSIASCPRKSPAASEWMQRNALPVAMACIACHPAADGQLAPVITRPTTGLGGAL